MNTIKYDSNANVYVSYCPKYNIHSQGTTYDEAVLAINDAIESYLYVKNKKGG